MVLFGQGGAAVDEQERKQKQRATRDQQLSEIEQSLNDAGRTIEDSKRQIARTHELLDDRRKQDARDDKADDEAEKR